VASYWTFKDYVAAGGMNEIHAWLDGLPERAKAKINWRIRQLEATKNLTRPAVGMLTRDCDGLIELRVEVGNVQYRPLCCHGPGVREVTLLFGAIEKGGKFEPLSACLIALRNKARIAGRGRTCDHDFS